MNIGLDLWFVVGLQRGVAGGRGSYGDFAICLRRGNPSLHAEKSFPALRVKGERVHLRLARVKEIASFSALTCVQQSIMNLGILLVQGLVNSFGTTVMGRLCRGGEDRLLRLHARSRISATPFSTFIAPELRRGRAGAHARRAARGGEGVHLLLYSYLGAHLAAGRAFNDAVHRRARGGGDRRGRALSAHRGLVLLRHRLPVFALRPLPGPSGGRACPWC